MGYSKKLRYEKEQLRKLSLKFCLYRITCLKYTVFRRANPFGILTAALVGAPDTDRVIQYPMI